MVKVLHIISSLKVGGAESLLSQLAPQLQAKEVDVSVIYFHEGPNADRLRAAGIKTFRVWGKLYKYDLFFFIKFLRLVRQVRPDYIHTHLWFANVMGCIAGKLFDIPVISTVHLVSTLEKKASASRFRYWVDRLAFRFAKQLVMVGKQMGEDFRKNYAFVPAQKISVIPNGIDFKAVRDQGFKERASRKALGIDKDVFVFGSVGRLIPRKNYANLIHIFTPIAKERNSCLLIIGGGPEEDNLKRLSAELGIADKVKIVSASSAYQFYPLMNAYVTVSFEEGLSIALLEALSFGLSIIVQKEAQSHEAVIDGYNGYIRESDVQLQVVMEALLEDSQRAEAFGKNSQRMVEEKFSLDSVAKSYKNIYL